MSLEQLRADLRNLGCNFQTFFVCPEELDLYRLTKNSPANVGNDGNVYIMASLSDEEKLQAEGHELAHLLLKQKGLVSLINYEDLHNLPLEINNLLSHHLIVKILNDDYGISSDLHLRKRRLPLNNAEKYIEGIIEAHETNKIDTIDMLYYLYAFGVQLNDIERTIPELKERVANIAKINSNVNNALQASKRYLQEISLYTNNSDQIQLIKSFLLELDCNVKDFEFNE